MLLIQKISEPKFGLLYLYYYTIYNDILNNTIRFWFQIRK